MAAGEARRSNRGSQVILAVWVILAATGSGCRNGEHPPAPDKSPEALAVERKAGDFLDYYEEVIVLSRRHAAHPDSFQIALEALPGSNLTVEEWEAWTEPYRDDPRLLTLRLETTIANLGRGSDGN
jgi:hypothetical protein